MSTIIFNFASLIF